MGGVRRSLEGVLFEDMSREELIEVAKLQAEKIMDLQDQLDKYLPPKMILCDIPQSATGDEFQ